MAHNAVEKISWRILASSLALFSVVICHLMSNSKNLLSWQLTVDGDVIHVFAVALGIILALSLYSFTRLAAHGASISENTMLRIAATCGVALSTCLMYALFITLAETIPPSMIMKLSAFSCFLVVFGFLTYRFVRRVRTACFPRSLMRQHAPVLALVVIAAAMYFSLASCSLSEWDSFNFARAIERFDLSAHQPHPPGYSLYVFLGRVAFTVFGERLRALTSISAISGALCLLPVYVMTWRMHDRETALVTCLALMSTRMYWLASEKAVTHMFATFLVTLAVCFLWLGFEGKSIFFFASWPMLGIAFGARPSYFPFIGLWIYAVLRRRDFRKLPAYLAVFICFIASWLIPTVLLTGWGRFWDLIGRQYVYVSTNEFVGARYGMAPLERLLFMLGGLISCGFGAPIQLMYARTRLLNLQDAPSILILCVLAALACFSALPRAGKRWSWRKTFLALWIAPYFLVVYLMSAPSYPRYFLPILPPIVIAVVSTAWSTAGSIRLSRERLNLKARLLHALVVVLILLNFLHSSGLAATIHTTEVPMVRLARYVKSNYGRSTVVIVFHEYRALETHSPGCRVLSAQNHLDEILQILQNLKNQVVLITDTAVRYVLEPMIQKLGLVKVEVAKFEIDPQVETEQHTIILYQLSQALLAMRGMR